MPIQVDFAGRKRIEALWNSLVEHYDKSGIHVEELKERVNRGYLTGYFPPPLKWVNDESRVEAPEIVDFCYSDEKLHFLLHKHGFPLPIGMNDFDNITSVDDKWRTEIGGNIDQIQRRFTAGKDISDEGTDPYRRELSKRINDYLSPIVDWEEDCEQEATDWQALDKRCGACTEKSNIYFSSYRHAELNPSLLLVKDVRPTISRLSLMSQQAGDDFLHVLIGIPLAAGGYLQIDPVSGEFDIDYEYAYPVSARYSALFYLENQVDRSKGNRRSELLDLEFDVVPDEPRFFINRYLNDIGKLASVDLDSAIRDMQERYGNTPRIDFYSSALRLYYTKEHGVDVQELMKAANDFRNKLRALCKADPEAGSLELVLAAMGTTSVEEALSMIKASVRLNPRYHKSINLLHELAGSHLNEVGMIRLYEDFVKMYPKHSHFRLRLAEAYLDACGKTGDISYAEKGFEHALVLAKDLENERPEPHFFLGHLSLRTGRPKLAMESFEAAHSRLLVGEGNLAIDITMGTIMAGIFNGARKYVNDSLERLRNLVPDEWASRLAYALYYTPFDIKFGADGKEVGRDEIRRRSDIMLSVLDEIAAEPIERHMADLLYTKWCLFIFVSSNFDEDIAKEYFTKIVDPEDERVQELIANFFRDKMAALYAIDRFPGRHSLDKASRALEFFGRRMHESRRKVLLPACAHLARHAFDFGDKSLAGEALEKAISIDPGEGLDKYFNVVVSEFYTLCQENRPDSDKKKMCDISLEAANLLWLRRKEVPGSTLKRLNRVYDLIANEFEKLGQADRAELARDRAKAIKDEIDRE